MPHGPTPILTPADVKKLVQDGRPPCVSLYLPTHRTGRETRQDPVRLDNLLKVAAERLAAHVGSTEAEHMLEPAKALIQDELFWRYQSDGLAFLASRNGSRVLRVPMELDERVLVGRRFYVKPLLPLVTGSDRFFVLALSQNQVRLLEASRAGMREVEIPDVPKSLTEAVGGDFEQKTLQFRTDMPRAGGERARTAMFHGHGAGADDTKSEMERFLQLVDDGVRNRLQQQAAPLVVAAVDSVASLFLNMTKHRHVVPTPVTGNFDRGDVNDLHAKSWSVVQPVLEEPRREAVSRFNGRIGRGSASTDLAEILREAVAGRVECVFLDCRSHRWGRYDDDRATVDVHEGTTEAEALDNDLEDLFDRAAVETLMHGGRVYASRNGDVPGGGEIAAVFRF